MFLIVTYHFMYHWERRLQLNTHASFVAHAFLIQRTFIFIQRTTSYLDDLHHLLCYSILSFSIYPQNFSKTKNTVVPLKTSQTITKLYSCGIKNTLNEVTLLTAMTKFIYKQKRMKTTITKDFDKMWGVKSTYWDQPNLIKELILVVKIF